MATPLLDYGKADTFTRSTEAVMDPRDDTWHWFAPGQPRVFEDGAILVNAPQIVYRDK